FWSEEKFEKRFGGRRGENTQASDHEPIPNNAAFRCEVDRTARKNEMSFRSQYLDDRARGVAPKTRSLGRLRIAVLCVVSIFLAWLVIRQSFAAYFAYFAPETALWLQPQQPLALVNLADQTLNLQANLHPSNPAVSDQTPKRSENASAK